MEFVKKTWNYISGNPKGQLVPLVLILGIGSFFYFHNLNSDYITLWDEAVHVNIVKNLDSDPWLPKLHLTDIGIDFQDWTNNYIWVHKPLMPLYLQAAVYKIHPSLFMFRLPGALFALMSIVALFFVARRHFGYIPALISSSLLAFNSYMFELVKGRQFSGLHDLMFLFFGILALDRVLRIFDRSSSPLEIRPLLNPPLARGGGARRNYLWFGLFAGLAYMSKGGLALLLFPALFIVAMASADRKTSILNFFYTALIACFIAFPEKIFLLISHPAEYYFEQGLQALHLFKGLEYWGRPWDYYLTVYLRDLVLPYLYLPAVAGVIFGLWVIFKKATSGENLNTVQYLRNRPITILTVWVLSFFIPLSFGLTKISNFIFAALPAILILLALMFKWLWDQKHNALMFALPGTVILSYIIIRLDVARVKYHLFQDQVILQRFAILFFELLMFFALWVIYRMFEKYWKTVLFAKTLAVLSLFLILGTYARANRLSDSKVREDYEYQQKVKQAALEVRVGFQKDAIFLIYYPKLLKSHLYFQYWSGLDAMEIYDRQPIFVLKRILPKNRPLFVLSNEQINRPDVKSIKKCDFGYIYSLNYEN